MERFSLELPAWLIVADETGEYELIELLTSNICAGGAYFKTERLFSVGTKVKIDIILPIDKLATLGGKKSRIDISGSVIRTDEDGMALCFDKSYNLSPHFMDA